VSERSAVGEGRDNLLASLFDRYGEVGPSPDLSMRQIAEQLGVHHTLLIYHFGSKPRLLAAVLAEARRRDNALIAAADADLSFRELATAVWEHYSHPDRIERTRAFFHVAGLAMYDADAYADFFAELDELTHLLERAARNDGLTPKQARRKSVSTDACIRGLLFQRVLSEDAAEVDLAARYYLASLGSSETQPA
jgi:AcrR family transcriptional regulator